MKNIRKRHRDALEENKILQHRFEDEKDLLYRIIGGQNEANQLRHVQDQQTREDFEELQTKYNDLRTDNEAKVNRIAELEAQVGKLKQKCKTVKDDSVEAVVEAARQTEHRITCIDEKHGEEMDALRTRNNELQDRLKVAENKQPVHIFHTAQVGTVCNLLERLRQAKEVKKEEVLAKDEAIKELGAKVDQHQQAARVLKAAAKTDRKKLQETANMLSETKDSLQKAEARIRAYGHEVEGLNHLLTWWKSKSQGYWQQVSDLKDEVFNLQTAQRNELYQVQAKNEGLSASNEWLSAAKERLEQELEAWETGSVSSVRANDSKHEDALPGTVKESLVSALKAANTRADGLQMSVNGLQAEKEALQKQLQSQANTHDSQIQQRLEHLGTENQLLRNAAADAQTLKEDLTARFTMKMQQLEQQFADKKRELDLAFNQGYEHLRALRDEEYVRGLRDQLLTQERLSKEERDRATVAADLQHQLKHQDEEDRFTAECKEREDDLQRKADDLQRKEDDLQRKEDDIRNREIGLALQVSNLDASDENFVKMKSRAEKAEEEGRQLRIAVTNHENNESLMVQYLSDQMVSLRRDVARHSDLLNEETGKMDVFSREVDLHNELQMANCSINYFRFRLDNNETSSEALSQCLYGADFYESDVHLLMSQERPVLLAQLQAAKRTLEGLRSSLAEGLNVNVGMAMSILLAPRGDENAAKPAEDIFNSSNEYPPSSSHQPTTRKRAGPPLGAPTYGEHDDNTAYDDWGGQTVDTGAKISTPEEILSRKRSQPKSRLNRGPAIPLPPH